MATFKKSATNDIFISARYDELGMSKSDLESWFKENACGSTGGSSYGVTEEWVEEYVSESISGKADTSDVQNVASDVATVSGDVSTLSGSVESNHNAITALNGDVSSLSGDVANKADTTAVTASINAAVSGKMDTSAFNTYSASTDARLSEDEEVTSAALNEVNDALSGKADTTAVTESINAAVSGKADTSAVTASITAAVSGKQDTLVSGTNIKTINNESLLGSGNIDIQGGGGKAIVAGRGIAITTGETADTVSFDLPLSASTNDYSSTDIALGNNLSNETNSHNLKIGKNLKISGATHYAIGISHKTNNSSDYSILKGDNSVGLGYFTIDGDNAIGIGNVTVKRYGAAIGYSSNAKDFAVAIGYASNANGTNSTALSRCTTNNNYEFGCGAFNKSVSGSSTWGDSGNTLFAVGDGTSISNRHNAFEIRQNGDIYITKDGSDVSLDRKSVV